ncbi:MAG: nucleoside hydrolase [Planctomycetaceae bacterium]|nr:nucleoside hydrolase [Planctomycetaceae bacterium]
MPPSPAPRKVIIDVDPGIDDAVALALALFDPRLEVVAVTAVGGNVPPAQATENLQALVGFLDPPRLPRLGVAAGDVVLPARPFSMHGTDGLGGAEVPRVPLHGGHLSEKVIWECLKAHPREITIIALGPLTNVSRVLARDPSIVELIGELVICGGTVHGAGSATPVADFNFYCDPAAARHVLREPVTKTLVPLETTSQVVLGFSLLDELPDDFSRAGRILRRMLGHAFRAHRQILGSEGICLHDVVALVAATNPELFERVTVAADVETAGELTAGMLVVDRRQTRQWRPNVDLLVGCDATAVQDCILRGFAAAADAT